MAFTGDLWRVCSSPISDLRMSSTVSMTKRLRSMILSPRLAIPPAAPVEPWPASPSTIRWLRIFRRMPVQAALPERVEHLAADVALVGVELACQVPGDLIEHAAVGDVPRGDLQRHDLALVVDHEVQLEAEKPSHGSLAAGG